MFCKNCGSQLNDDAVFCSNCGAKVNESTVVPTTETQNMGTTKKSDGLGVTAKVFMILSCIALGFYIIPLAWTIPMTVIASNKMKRGEPLGVGFKVCILLFVNTLSGILLLCRQDQ